MASRGLKRVLPDGFVKDTCVFSLAACELFCHGRDMDVRSRLLIRVPRHDWRSKTLTLLTFPFLHMHSCFD